MWLAAVGDGGSVGLMLYLTRKVGEAVVIDNNIKVEVVEFRGRSVKLGFTFPETTSVLRQELYERIQSENQAATGDFDALFGLDLETERPKVEISSPRTSLSRKPSDLLKKTRT